MAALALPALPLTAQYIKYKSGQFDLEDVTSLKLNSLGIASLSVSAPVLFRCTSLVSLELRKNDVRASMRALTFQQRVRADSSPGGAIGRRDRRVCPPRSLVDPRHERGGPALCLSPLFLLSLLHAWVGKDRVCVF